MRLAVHGHPHLVALSIALVHAPRRRLSISRQRGPREGLLLAMAPVPTRAAGFTLLEALDGPRAAGCRTKASIASAEEASGELLAPLWALADTLAASDGCSQDSGAVAAVDDLLEQDAVEKLVVGLPQLGFEAQKVAARAASLLLRLAGRVDAPHRDPILKYLRDRPAILTVILDGCGHQEAFHHYGLLLQRCAECEELAKDLLQAGAFPRLIEQVQCPNFDMSAEAFASLRALLLMQKPLIAEYISKDFADFFALYHTLLEQNREYIVVRQALRLLGEILLNGAFREVMVEYIRNDRFLQIHMNLLRSDSVPVNLEAFHIFKIFVANPRQPPRVTKILCRNRDRLIRHLEAFGPKQRDESFKQDLGTIIETLCLLPSM